MNNIIRKILCGLISAISFGIAIYFSFFIEPSNSAMTGIWLTFSLFSFVLAWPEMIASVSFLGSSMQLREMRSSLGDIKHLVEANTRAILELVQTQMRFGGVPDDQKDRIYEDLERVLKSTRFSNEEIGKIQERWHYWVSTDYVRGILTNTIYHAHIPEDKKNEWLKKRKEILLKVHEITADELRETFRGLDGYSDEVKELIDDFEYYREHLVHRRPDVWRNRKNWFKSSHA